MLLWWLVATFAIGAARASDHDGAAIVHFDAAVEIVERYGGLVSHDNFSAIYGRIVPLGDDHGHGDHGHGEEPGHDDHGHDNHEHSEEPGHDDHGHRARRQDVHEEAAPCWTSDEVFESFDADGDEALNATELRGALGAATGVAVLCEHDDDAECDERPTAAQSWGYAMLATLLISAVSLIGAAVLPVYRKSWRKPLVETLVSFAVGTLVGDALMHLAPTIVSMSNAHGVSDGLGDGGRDVWPMALATYSVGIFFLFHRIVDGVQQRVQQRKKKSADAEEPLSDAEDGAKKPLKEVQPVGWLNLVTDAVHNFTDGLALGAAFSVSLGVGLSTAIAVFLHEVPQELGDFAILLEAGFSRRRALLLNAASALVAVLGTVIGVGVGTAARGAQRWLLAFTVGGFIYVAMSIMTPLLHKRRGARHTQLQTFTMGLGMHIMFIIAIFEPHPECGAH